MRQVFGAAVFALSLLSAMPAYALPCGGDGPPCDPPPPPPKSALPPGVVSYGDGAALIPSGIPGQSGQSFHIGGNAGDYVVGSASATASTGSIQLAPYGSGLAIGETAAGAGGHALAQIQAYHGQNQTPIDAISNIFLLYKVTLHARDTAAASALFVPLNKSGAIASVTGQASLSATGSAYSAGIITTGVGIFENSLPFAGTALYGKLGSDFSLLGRTQFSCAPTSFGFGSPDTSGCGLHAFTLPVNFVSATNYAGGSPLDFIGNIELRAFAQGTNGTALAFVDPQVTLFPGLDPNLYSLTLGASGVPEPASWLMMIIGFGVIGTTMRRRKAEVVV